MNARGDVKVGERVNIAGRHGTFTVTETRTDNMVRIVTFEAGTRRVRLYLGTYGWHTESGTPVAVRSAR
jgi:hypothetical protein